MSRPEPARPGQRRRARISALAVLLAAACTRKEPAPRAADEGTAVAFLKTYADIAEAAYGDARKSAALLLTAAQALRDAPSAATLGAARDAWSRARVPYARTEAYRFYGGPIDAVEPLVNTWPIDEEYIESSDGKPSLVTDAVKYPALSRELLVSLNMKEGETSVTTGYHAIEFLLWGKDTRADGPGERDAIAFDGRTPLGARRGAYLVAACELLLQHLSTVAAEWSNPGGRYREHLASLPRAEALALVVKGAGTLSGPELSGERLTVAYETKDQENEHSCFSDTTSSDLAGNAAGVLAVCTGRYQGQSGATVAGPGLCDVVAGVEPALGARLRAEIERGAAAANALPAPFDQAILGSDDAPGRQAVAAAIAALSAQAETLKLAAAAVGPKAPLATAR